MIPNQPRAGGGEKAESNLPITVHLRFRTNIILDATTELFSDECHYL